jgi:putative oxidoreductase
MKQLARSASRFAPGFYVVLRVVAGLMFAAHGADKLFGWPVGEPKPTGTQLWWGGLIELVCGALVAAGLFTRAAAFLASGTMAVAYFQFHWKLDLSAWKWLPGINRGETAALYCFLFLYVVAQGPGHFSLDRRLRVE